MGDHDNPTATERALPADGAVRQRLLEVSPVPIAILDSDRRVVLANERAESELGLREDELLGIETDDPAIDAFDEDGDPIPPEGGITAEVLETGEPVYDRVYRVELPGADSIWISTSATPIFDDDGEVANIALALENVTEQRRRQRRFDAVFNNTFQFTGLLEPDGTLIEANDAALAFGGVAEDDVIGEKVWETYWFQIDEETPEQVRSDVERAAEGEFVRYELEVQGAEGPAVIDFSLKPITNERGEVTLIVPEGRDITELKRREEQLREERAFNQSVFAGLPDVLYAFDQQGNFLRWNDRFEEVTGYEGDEIEEMQPLDFVPEEEAEIITENIARVIEDGEMVTVESYLETKSGEWLPYEFTGAPLVARDGEELGLVGIGRDIAERKERERRFSAVFDNTFQFTGLMDPDGTMVEANQTALSFAGVDREEVVGRHLAETVWIREENRERIYDAVERAREGEFVRFELEINGDGGPAIIDFSLKPVTDEHGRVDMLIPEGRDITELKERERELAQKTAELERTVDRLERTNAELEQFAYVASHDLQEPLRMISSYLDALEMKYGDELDDRATRYIDFAVDGAERMREMIDDLLTFSRVQTREEEFESIDLASVLRDVRDNLTVAIDESGATITNDDLPTVRGDRNQLRQLFQNLLENAIEYAGDEPPRIHVTTEERETEWVVAVSDEGVGIHPEEQDRIFDIFMRGAAAADEGGSGIGLAICKRVVENHGGHIEVDSTPSEGTTVRFTLAKTPDADGGVAP